MRRNLMILLALVLLMSVSEAGAHNQTRNFTLKK